LNIYPLIVLSIDVRLKFRIIDFALSNCLNSGLRGVAVITQYESHLLIQHLQRGWSFLHGELNEMVDVLPADHQGEGKLWYRGTADAVSSIARSCRRRRTTISSYRPEITSTRWITPSCCATMCRTGAAATSPAPACRAGGDHLRVMTIDAQRGIIAFLEDPVSHR
jgi:glucose-1-phosphate adenylyltransferase